LHVRAKASFRRDRFQVRDSTVAGFPGISTQPNSHFHLDVQADQTRF
jgi:hypothetical protein